MNTIGIVTATRAEYGLLSLLIRELRMHESEDFCVELIVTGTHLDERFGSTIDEIRNDGIRIDKRIKISIDTTDGNGISFNQADALIKFSELFSEVRYSGIVILGDRYEMLSVAIAASNALIPIFHLCGGDTSEGATDEWIRHSITKMSYAHFVTNEMSKKRVIQLGEDPDRVFNYGSTSVDNIIAQADMTKTDALKSIGLDECSFVIGTYHPVTLDEDDIAKKINDFISAIASFPNIQFIITKANADKGGEMINSLLEKASESVDNIHLFSSLGVRRYLSLMKHCEFVIGNSSSGIIETPVFKIPTVNIGDRQRGRGDAVSIINCAEGKEDIIAAINTAMSDEFREKSKSSVNIYGDGNASLKIAAKIMEIVNSGNIDLKKRFYNIEF